MDAADWQVFADDLRFLHTPPVCVVARSNAQSIPSAIDTAIAFDLELVDTDGMHSTVSNTSRITFGLADRYFCTGFVRAAIVLAGSRRGYIASNTGGIEASENEDFTTVAVNPGLNPHTVDRFQATGFIELYFRQNSGGNLNTIAGQCSLGACWVGD